MSELKRPKCPRCGSEDLALGETTEVHTSWPGPFYIDEYGYIATSGVGWHEPGNITGWRMTCRTCEHDWKPRRPFSGSDDGP